jgi:hypothetical protein
VNIKNNFHMGSYYRMSFKERRGFVETKSDLSRLELIFAWLKSYNTQGMVTNQLKSRRHLKFTWYKKIVMRFLQKLNLAEKLSNDAWKIARKLYFRRQQKWIFGVNKIYVVEILSTRKIDTISHLRQTLLN